MKVAVFALCLFVLAGACPTVQAGAVGYVPMDDRPVNLEYVLATVRAAGTPFVTPPSAALAGRERAGNPDRLWQWVFEQAPLNDAMALSSDSLIYGGLVPSRTHFFSENELAAQVDRFRELKRRFPSLRLYVFGTVMRTPKMSAGATEPPYYEKQGPAIFRITALEDKREGSGLSDSEAAELKGLLEKVPAQNLADWRARRAKNYRVNEQLQQLAREGLFQYLLLGRDDSSPLSASHQESRHLEKSGADLSAARYLSIPGADNLGMSMVVHAINDIESRLPFVKVFYAPGAGGATVPTYEDHPLAQTVPQHIVVSGGVKLDLAEKPDLVLAVNTPADGLTREANQPGNGAAPNPAVQAFVQQVRSEMEAGRLVAIGDVAFANGADNSLMAELRKSSLLRKPAAYSGWNTAGNTLGYAVGQGMLAPYMSEKNRLKMLAVRYLDDWGYQANIRGELYEELVYPSGNNGQYLNELKPKLTRAAIRKIRRFAAMNLWGIPEEDISAEFPWNRMFEISIQVQ
jgi:hypothetical protein